jgi:hypothetical protein
MTCSFMDFYTLKSETLQWPKTTCTKNFPVTIKLLPHQRDSVELHLIFKDSKARLVKYQITMELAKDEDGNDIKLLYHKKLKSTTISTDEEIWKQ